uniref:Uncharacterized protein n=1 Tax=Cucumis melo TaxID=3656 RepID=A0A9I9E8S7_CUCME
MEDFRGRHGEGKAMATKTRSLGTMVKTKLGTKSDSNKHRNVKTRRKSTTNVGRHQTHTARKRPSLLTSKLRRLALHRPHFSLLISFFSFLK